jgi:hypothetical protein
MLFAEEIFAFEDRRKIHDLVLLKFTEGWPGFEAFAGLIHRRPTAPATIDKNRNQRLLRILDARRLMSTTRWSRKRAR